ncbi:hypothetical protein BpHYR1_014017 [Brachionus plicatilis]|uniref:Uncharacterized protein n=1 Tax=Brachionus plicatilis TaxID=10195 RepID=A0A3M7PQC4_BRAPC|nr:hypothetical protein BpHYR1_014017 [Brachionus plicatilis]
MATAHLDTSFINCQKRRVNLNEETIEWEEHSLNEEKETVRSDFQRDILANEGQFSLVKEKTPFSVVNTNNIFDSLELYFTASNYCLKQPELTDDKLSLS